MSAPVLDPRDLAREAVRALPLYAPTVAAGLLDLSDSTNLWGAPPAAVRVIAAASGPTLARYPSLRSESLEPALLRYLGLDDAPGVRAVTGCGSDDVLDAAMRAFGEAGDRVALAAPTFSMISLYARLNGLELVTVPFDDGFGIDPERLVDARAKITYLCAPNNPTATPLRREAVEFVATHAAGIVVLDEAYAEFAPESFASLAARFDRLLVTRTFSKAFGLAGLRVGYAVGAAALVGMVERARGPYKVNVLAERAARAALDDADDALRWVRRHASLAVAHRDRLAAALTAIGLEPLPSTANFLFVPTARAAAIARRLQDCGVLVRLFTGLPRAPRALARAEGSALRIGVGPWEDMERLLAALEGAT